jgi:hypothetical protein
VDVEMQSGALRAGHCIVQRMAVRDEQHEAVSEEVEG